MEIQLKNVSKKFNREWIFQDLNLHLSHNDSTAIIGPNGSGKSTLLQLIAGSLLPTTGKIMYAHELRQIEPDQFYKYLSLAAPALSLPEDFTLNEFLKFHFNFKKLKSGQDIKELPDIFKLGKSRNKFIKNFSTGMKQRVKLGVAFYADSPLILLDEPATNLDAKGFEWYMHEIEKIIDEKMVFICSNRREEYSFCKSYIDILDYKK